MQEVIAYVLIYQENSNVLPFLCETIECLLDSSIICLVVHNEEVLLRVWRSSNMLVIFSAILSVWTLHIPLHQRVTAQSQSP